MHVETIVVGELQANCFVVHGGSEHAIVIDPGADAARIIAVLEQRRLSVTAYILTHGHVDHVSAVGELYGAFPAPIGLHEADLEWAFRNSSQISPLYPAAKPPPGTTRALKDDQEWSDGGLTYRIISTPGHTPGSVCVLFPEQNLLFSGDTLFAGSVGRTDLPGGSSRSLSTSLAKIALLPDYTIVYPGHGPPTNIAHEKRANFFMQSPLQ